MKKVKKLLSLLAASLMVLALVPSFGTAGAASRPLTASERAEKLENLSDFAQSVAEITSVYDRDLDSRAEGEFALARIIVKSARELHDEKAAAEASGYNDWHVFQYSSPEEAQAALTRFERMSCVEWAEPDGIMRAFATPGSGSFNSWGFGASHINAYAYNEWLYSLYGSVENMPEVIVAVIDTGADSTHPFLQGRLVPGWNFVDNNSDPADGHMHGTHVSGTIVDGTFANVKVMPLKVLSDSGSGSELNVGLGMEYAYLHGASVSNLSLGGLCDENESHYFMAEIVDSSYDNGTAVIVAAGNESQDAANCCPANIERLCTVASIGTNHSLSYFSNYGAVVDVAAPGEDISSSVPGGGYETADGTSMACPHVAAVAALIKTANPEMSADGVVSAIKGTAAPISATNAGAGMAHLDADLFTLNPAANAEGGTYHFASAGSYAWTVDGDSAVSGNAGVNNTTSAMKTELYLGPDQTITFDYKVSSEQGKDYFRVKANGSVIFETSGETDWQTETVTVPASGSVEITFEFYKNASGAAGSDRAWVKNVKVSRSLTSAANLTGGTVPFASSGAYPWAANDEENAAMSGNAGVNSSESVMTAEATLSKGMLIRFKYKVDAASGDIFIFRLDGRAVLTSGATDGYVDHEYVVPSSGSHTFEFIFSKNASGASGADAAFVKAFAVYYSFDAAVNADGGDLPFTNDAADYPWFAMHDYVSSSNFGMGGTSSCFTLTLPMNAGETLSFRYKVSSVESFDYFKFYADNEQLLNVSGEISWTNYTFTATQSKTYTFKWSFDKDPWDFSSWVGCDDAAFVDDVAYSGSLAGLLGDINDNGVVDAEDAILALRYSMQMIDGTGLVLANGDMNGDGVVDSSDALMILRKALGII